MNSTRVVPWFLLIPSALFAQSLTINGVYNEAGNGRFSPGMRARIFVGLPANLSLEPGTVTVQVRGRPAPVLEVERAADYGGNQWLVHIQLPVDLASGLTTLVLTTRAGSSPPQNIRVEPYAPGLLRLTRQTPLGEVPASYLPPCPPPGEAPAAGEIVTAFAVGLGATDPVVPTGMRAPATPPAVTVVKPRISVLWQEAEVLESVLVPGDIGLYRVRFRVPPGDGWHPLALQIGGYDSFPLMLPVGRGLINVSSAAWGSGPAAPEQILVASACANSLATGGPFLGDPRNPPTTLGGTTVKVKDSAGVERPAPLHYVDRFQVNYVVPSGTALGSATVAVTSGDGAVSTGRLEIQPVAPGVFPVYGSEIDWDGGSVTLPAAQVVRLRDGVQTVEPLFRVNAAGQIVPVPIDLGRDTDQVSLTLFGTGWRFRSSLANVVVYWAGGSLPVEYAGPQGEFSGLDQINVRISRSLLAFHGGEGLVQIGVDGRFASAGYLPFH